MIFNATLDAVLCGVFLVLVTVIVVDSVRVWAGILRGTEETSVRESPSFSRNCARRSYEGVLAHRGSHSCANWRTRMLKRATLRAHGAQHSARGVACVSEERLKAKYSRAKCC